jgi:hypothetical protein
MTRAAFVITHKFLFDCLTNGDRTHFKLLNLPDTQPLKNAGNLTLLNVG